MPRVRFLKCGTCRGTGEVWTNESSRRDPQCDVPNVCPECDGDGVIVNDRQADGARFDEWEQAA